MLRTEFGEVYGLESAIRGMRNPMNSWARSDSGYCDEHSKDCVDCTYYKCGCYKLGDNDLGLCKRLISAGNEHRKFLRQISVSVDIIAPLYWWKEFDTYKVGTTANSTSTMHKIHTKQFEPSDFSFDDDSNLFSDGTVEMLLHTLNKYREMFNATKNKEYFRNMIQLLPSSYNQKRTVTMNYENLLNIYFQRKNHKLTEWHTLCDWIIENPYIKEFIECTEKKPEKE